MFMRETDMRLGARIAEMGSCLEEKRRVFRNVDLTEVGKEITLRRLNEEELASFGEVVGVDGSVNRKGGEHPHYVELYRGLALGTQGGETVRESLYTPLLDDALSSKRSEDILTAADSRKRRLAEIELEVAIAHIEAHPPTLLMMDGGLLRYKIFDPVKWTKLRQLCLEKEVLLIGVIKDIKTSIFGEEGVYDREVLYGRLDYAKAILVDDDKNDKSENGLSSAFLRTSKGISVVGLDMLKEQGREKERICNLLFTLTPEHGRSVPLWLDIVDREAKIGNEELEGLLQQNLDRDIYQRYFVSERDLRR